MAANHALMTARARAGLSQGALARRIRETGHRLGYPNECTRGNVSRWEAHGTQPQAHYLVILESVLGQPAKALGFHDIDTGELPAGTLLGSVSFPATVLTGSWVTSYQFDH